MTLYKYYASTANTAMDEGEGRWIIILGYLRGVYYIFRKKDLHTSIISNTMKRDQGNVSDCTGCRKTQVLDCTSSTVLSYYRSIFTFFIRFFIYRAIKLRNYIFIIITLFLLFPQKL
jgi:hypothetical protein